MFLFNTVENILRNKQGKTEVIVGLDGAWSDPGIPAHPDVTIYYSPEPLGQRGMTNQLARLSQATYVMKLDAHCALDEGFDVKLMAKMEPDITMLPAMYNLHAFDWECLRCGTRWYQGPTPQFCHSSYEGKEKNPNCGNTTDFRRVIVWEPRRSRRSEFFRFDKTLHFQYWGDYKRRPEAQGDLAPTLSAQGSCFMLTREKYWELEISDENLAGKTGWGQQGVEVACKTWLSGGRLMVNKTTWYAHMFRTQGGDFGFPFPISGREVDETRQKSRELFQMNNWNKAKHTFEWLLDKFRPVPEWHDGEDHVVANNKMISPEGTGLKKSIIFYTDNQLPLKYAKKVQQQLRSIGLPIVSASLKPMDKMGKNIHINLPRGLDAYFQQIIGALESSDADIVYMCEHDVLYHPSHFEFIPQEKDKFYYNQNFWRVRPDVDNFAVHWDANQVSGLVAYRELLLKYYKDRYAEVKTQGFNRSYEPGGRNSALAVPWKSEYPNIDIRGSWNLTRSKWSPRDFRDKSTCVNWQEGTIETIPGWHGVAFL